MWAKNELTPTLKDVLFITIKTYYYKDYLFIFK